MSAPNWNTSITIRNRHSSSLIIESVTASGGAPPITAPNQIASGSNGAITSMAVYGKNCPHDINYSLLNLILYSAGIGTQGAVQYHTQDGGTNTVQIWINFTCNNNNVTADIHTSKNTVQIVRISPSTGSLENPLTGKLIDISNIYPMAKPYLLATFEVVSSS